MEVLIAFDTNSYTLCYARATQSDPIPNEPEDYAADHQALIATKTSTTGRRKLLMHAIPNAHKDCTCRPHARSRKVSTSRYALSMMMNPAHAHASTATARGTTCSPILARLDVKSTSGTTAKGSWNDSTT